MRRSNFFYKTIGIKIHVAGVAEWKIFKFSKIFIFPPKSLPS